MNENVKSENKDKANKTKAAKVNKQNNKPKISFIVILIKFRNWLREWEPIGVLIAIIALLVSIILGIFQFNEWQEERKARAWQILTTRTIGNSGKKEALEFLASQKTSLAGIDLSCTTNNGKWDDENKKCDPIGVYLNKLDLSKKKHGHKVELRNSKFEGAHLEEASFDGAHLYRSRFDGAYLEGASFDGANLGLASFDGAVLSVTSFDGAILYYASFDSANLAFARFYDAYLKSTSFDGADLGSARFDGASLREASFDGADLLNARFERAYLLGASFDGARINSTYFSKAIELEPKQLETAWIWADTDTFFLPKLPPEWDKSARDIILFCHPKIRYKYNDDIREGRRKRGLPDPDKCKKWHKWPEETRKNWMK